MKGILKGMRLVEGSAFIAAPLGGMTLAQLGADVIRFDPIGGGLDYGRWPIAKGGQSLFWAGMNKGKRSIQVDIARPEGQELVAALIAAPGEHKGLFLTNFPERGWLAYDRLRAAREDLIYINVQGDRQGGTALDYTVNCAVGFACTTGPADSDQPTNHLLPAWDNIAGQMAAVALLAAERHRRLKGEGQLVRLALKDVAVATASNLGNIAEVSVNDEDRARTGNYLYGAFGRDFVCQDGVRVMIVGLTPRQWQGLVKAMQLEEAVAALAQRLSADLRQEGERFRHRQALAGLMEPWFAQRPYAEVCRLFDQEGVCYGPYRSFRQLVEEDADCSKDNPMMGEVQQPGIGAYLASGSPIRCAENLPALAAPRLGQHTEEVLKEELGMTDAALDRLVKAGTVALA